MVDSLLMLNRLHLSTSRWRYWKVVLGIRHRSTFGDVTASSDAEQQQTIYYSIVLLESFVGIKNHF